MFDANAVKEEGIWGNSEMIEKDDIWLFYWISYPGYSATKQGSNSPKIV